MTVWFQIPDRLKKYETVTIGDRKVLNAWVEGKYVVVFFLGGKKTFRGDRQVEGLELSGPRHSTSDSTTNRVMRPGKTARQVEARRRWEENRARRAEENRRRAMEGGAGRKNRK